MNELKVVKLNRRNVAYQDGFTHAFRFNHYEFSGVQTTIRSYLRDNYGYEYKNGSAWRDYIKRPRPYWIAVRDEQMITVVLLVCGEFT